MSYIGNSPALKYASFAVQHFTTSATTSYSLDNSVANENDIALFVNNVRQQPGASYAYTAAGTTLTLSAATTGSDTMYCVFIGKAVQTVVPPTGSVGTSELAALAVTNAKVADDAIGVDELSATGTARSSTFLRGDNSWTDPGGVALTGSTDNTVVTVTGADAIAGEANLQFDGTDLTVSTGNVVIGTAGKGIDFSATSGTGTSELLDDYEEGTWSCSLLDFSGTETVTDARYVKVGKVVHCWFSVATGSFASDGSAFSITGLPFTSYDATSGNSTGGCLRGFSNGSDWGAFMVGENSTTTYMYSGIGDAFNYNDFGQSKTVNGCFIYETAS